MANERNKILPYALSAIEGVNIQSQEDYSASSETTDGVSTGLANGNNFNKLAKQVSIMSSSLAEFIVNTLAEQTISDTNSIEEISSALNSAILKLIKDNEPVIPDKAGITVIDDNNTDITSFNQITEDGIYYIYKQLSDGPSQNGKAIEYNFIYLIVINAIILQYLDMCMQMTSFGPNLFNPIPGNIGSMPMIRGYNKTSQLWSDWDYTYGIEFINNSILISDFTPDKLNIKFPVIATDNTFPDDYNKFMYSATKKQMREQLGIVDSPDLTDYFNKKTDKLDLATQVTGQLKNANIADNAITTSKIASLAITEDKLALSSVNNDKIADGAVTNAKFSGTLSVAKGGTGSEDGYLFANLMTYPELRKRFTALGSGAVTTEQFINAITPTEKTAFKVDMISANTYISDFPLSNAILEVVRLTDNTVILTAKDLFVLTTYEFRKSPDGQFSGWKKIRNLDGTTPLECGGTSRADGFGFKNGITVTDLWNLLALSAPCTTQEFCDAFRNYCDNPDNKIPVPVGIMNCMVHTGFLSDLPSEVYFGNAHQLQIKYIDYNQLEMQLVAPYGQYSLFGGGISSGKFSGWKKLRNADGSIPADLIPPTVLTYTNDQGTWTETKLSDGTTMLEGWGSTNISTPSGGFKVNTVYSKDIQLPKACKKSSCKIVSNGRYIDLYGYTDNTITYSNESWDGASDIPTKIYISTIFYRQPTTPLDISFTALNIYWIFKGILA